MAGAGPGRPTCHRSLGRDAKISELPFFMNLPYQTSRNETMAPKRSGDAKNGDAENKKPRHGFRVGPENLPDGPWRRKGKPSWR